jgi:hypothetical protein
MSLTIFDILKYANVKREDTPLIDEKEIIRIEKKLKAAQKLNSELSSDAVEKTINALKNNLQEIKVCYSDDLLFHLFHRIKFKENAFLTVYYLKDDAFINMQSFLNKYVEEDLLIELKELFNQNKFKMLLKWQQINNLLPLSFKINFHLFLKEKLIYIHEILKKRPNDWVLHSKIPYAKKGDFYKLLNEREDIECEKIIYTILSFYSQNKNYTRGRDFTDALLHAMFKYKPQDIRLQSSILATSYNYAGSNRVAFIAVLCIFGFCALVILLFYLNSPASFSRTPRRYVTPKDEFFRKHDALNFRNHYLHRIKESNVYVGNQCDSIIIGPRIFGQYEPGIKKKSFTISNKIDLKTGANLHKDGMFNWTITSSDSNLYIHNNTKQHVLCWVYVSNCFYEEYNQYYPCEYPFAYNKVFIKAGEVLPLHYNFDSLAIQTGAQLFQLQRNNVDYKPMNYRFCPVTELDSMLQRTILFNRFPNDAINGIIKLDQSPKNYSLTWKGIENTIFIEQEGNYLKPNVPFIIKKK